MFASRPLVRASALALRNTSSTTTSSSAAQPMMAVMQAVRNYATPHGPPPKNFRLKPAPTWEQEKEGTFDKIGKYFLLAEMARGMYVLLEQFFRPPYTIIIPSRRDPSALGSAVNMRSDGIRVVRRGALLASSARLSALLKLLPSRLRSVPMARAVPPATILT